MKKALIISLVLMLTACGVLPAQQIQATPFIATVLVPIYMPTETAVPTEIPLPTQVPTDVPPATALPPIIPPTAEVIVVTATSAAPASDSPIPLDNVLGKGVFINMTMSGDTFTLRCFPRDITFNITANNLAIVDAQLYYRIVDYPAGLYPSEWLNAGKMNGDGNGNFTIVFSGESVNQNLRMDRAWFDFQFVGLSKSGSAIDRTQKIERLVTYRIDCP